MAMEGGQVAVTDDETVSGGGLARAIYNKKATSGAATLAAISDAYASSLATEGLSQQERESLVAQRDSSRLSLLRSWAAEANDLGAAIVDYLKDNATVSLATVKATVGTSTSVGRTPNPNNGDVPIEPPSAAVDLPVTGAGGATVLALT